MCYVFFFFSSRRRHTRYWRDWSSDVCSSDLGGRRLLPVPAAGRPELRRGGQPPGHAVLGHRLLCGARPGRSGERRVGEEGGYRWGPDLLKKKKKTHI